MSEIKTVAAELCIEMVVECPNSGCEARIDLLSLADTDGTWHNDGGALLRQMFPTPTGHDDFECDEVVCSRCKTTFNVRRLEW